MSKNSFTIRLKDELKEKIDNDAEEKGVKRVQIIREIVENHYMPKEVNRYAFLDDGCVLREYLNVAEAPKGTNFCEGFYCLKNAPKLIRLGSGIESAASKICAKCNLKNGIIEDSRKYKEQIKKGLVLTIPTCSNFGSIVNETMERIWCPKIGKERPVQIRDKKKETDYLPCNRADNNKPCRHLRLTETIINGRLKEKDNR